MNELSKKALLIAELNTGEYGLLSYRNKHVRLNKRKFSGLEARTAIKWAVSRGWLTTKPREYTHSWFTGDPVFVGPNNPHISQLDDDIIWELLKPALERCSGYSITKQIEWRKLGLWERGHSCFTDKMIDEMHYCLCRLSQSYIWFQSGGGIWCIEIRENWK